ncbi:LysM peptidoglycan-binding domain-containing protein [Candidatus Microgenomates bacterium]|nr:LysM peptidoglycan-binding domain-containing protein [Candidatus Microgenomates bacterium]
MKPNKGDYIDGDENWIHTEVLGHKKKRSGLFSNLIVAIVFVAVIVLVVLAFQNLFSKNDLSNLENLDKINKEKTEDKAPAEEKKEEPQELRYKVKAGDTLASIGAEFAVEWQKIAEKNSLAEPYALEVDQELIIPGVMAPKEEVKTEPAPEEVTSPDNGKTYTVQPGDTLAGVGLTLNLEWQKIAELNSISAPYALEVGQVLKLP